ncbi:phosphotransferase [Streptomyces sp. NPDC055089]
MSGKPRHTEPVDVHLILRRETGNGPEVFLSRRAGEVYAAGLWHFVSGHTEDGEDVVSALIREAEEEAGVLIDPADVRFAVAVHHCPPSARAARIGLFFEVRTWQGTPHIREPAVCDAMGWFPLGAPPAPMVAYCRAGLDAYRSGHHMALHFQNPDDPIPYDASVDRRRPVHTAPAPAAGPGEADAAVREFTERAVGRIPHWTDESWPRDTSRVWSATNKDGGTWYVKVHQNDRFHEREVRALRTWAGALGAATPRLVAADPALRAVVLTVVPGRPLHGMPFTPGREREIFRRIGVLARQIHQASAPRPAPSGSGPALAKADRHLAAARTHLGPGDEEFVRSLVKQAASLPPLEWVDTHGDLQLRNILFADDPTPGGAGFLGVIDLERSEPGPAVRDLVRLSDAWAGRPDLSDAFLTGYGRALTNAEEAHLVIEMALDSVSGIAYGSERGDLELVERGRRTLARLRAEHRAPLSPAGDAP